jgi:dTDP-4-dehydrorhamnose reductase
LVIKQLNGQYECKSEALRSYYEECKEILKSFPLVTLQHIPREHNEEANRLAQSASVTKRIKKCLLQMYVHWERILRRMIGEKRSLTI